MLLTSVKATQDRVTWEEVSSMKKMAPQVCTQAHLKGAIPHLTSSSQVSLGCVTFTKNNQPNCPLVNSAHDHITLSHSFFVSYPWGHMLSVNITI